jgi:CheY-like chemotaxis protein
MNLKNQPEYKYQHVLLVDDNEIDNFINERIIVTSMFAKSVTVRNSASLALDFIRTYNHTENNFPQFIFLDLNMPIMDGFAFLAEFAKFDEDVKKRCKVIVLSSSISPEDIDSASTNPYVYKYINKPLSEKYLEAINF